MMRRWVLGVGALALAMPTLPVVAADGTLTIVGGCGDPTLRVDIPVDRQPAPMDAGGCCDRIGCHIACDRQKRGQRRS
jgi:hypothetical protein